VVTITDFAGGEAGKEVCCSQVQNGCIACVYPLRIRGRHINEAHPLFRRMRGTSKKIRSISQSWESDAILNGRLENRGCRPPPNIYTEIYAGKNGML